MSLVHVDDDIVVAELVESLDDLASTVRREYRRSREALGESVDAYLVIGHALTSARAQLVSDQAFGAWVKAQEFGFSIRWAYTLRSAADHESAVRAEVGSQLLTGNRPNIEKAVRNATAALRPAQASPKEEYVPAAGIDKSRTAVELRVITAKQMAAEGHTSRQIAARLGLNEQSMHSFRQRHGIEVPADAAVGRTKRIDSDRIVSAAVESIDGIGLMFEQIVYPDLSLAEVPGWLAVLSEAIASLTTLRTQLNNLKETSQP